MDSPSFHEFKRKTCFFFKEQIKTARLAFTDVTPAEILTEEATDGDSFTLDSRTLEFISRAAFEVDDYWRIVDVLHKRLWKYDKKQWQSSYKALILLERLLTHGPKRVAEEFQHDKDIIWEMGSLKYVDERGDTGADDWVRNAEILRRFDKYENMVIRVRETTNMKILVCRTRRYNWGLSVRNKSEKILKLLEKESFLKEERDKARKITTGIKGSGSFCQRSSSVNPNSKEYSSFAAYGRCNSHYNTSQDKKDDSNKGHFIENERIQNLREYSRGHRYVPENPRDVDHPFCEDRHHQIRESLISFEG